MIIKDGDILRKINDFYTHLNKMKNEKFLLLGLKLLKYNDLTIIYGNEFSKKVLEEVCVLINKILGDSINVYHLEGTKFLCVCTHISFREIEQKFYDLQIAISSFEFENIKVGLTLIGSVLDTEKIELTEEKMISHIISSLDKSSSLNKYYLMYLGKDEIEESVKKMAFYSHVQSSIINDFEGFYLKYQPLISSKDGSVIGAEALLRWKSSIYGEVLPNDFIDYIETQPVFYNIGLWVLEKAMTDAKTILSTNSNFVMNVNISYSQLERKEFKDDVMLIINKLNFPVNNLQLELTERCRDIAPEYLYEQLLFFYNNGIKISLDDFGTGISSIDLLCNMPINTMKIDQMFIKNILTNSSCKSVVDMSIDCASKLGLKVCLEGVETEEIHDYVTSLNATYHQGFYYSKPIFIEEIKQIIDEKVFNEKTYLLEETNKNAKLVELLIKKQYRISCAESCTGGMLSSTIVDVANASKVLDMSFVTYSDEAKMTLIDVDKKVIDEYGVVSEEVAEQMAVGVANKANSNVGVGITGIAGPSGGTQFKPVGMVCFGICINGEISTYTKNFGNIGRTGVREKSVEFVIEKLIELLR